jgi:hypothetical protein
MVGIGIRHFLIFSRASLMRAASFAASQPSRRWSDSEKTRYFSAVRSHANDTFFMDRLRFAREIVRG